MTGGIRAGVDMSGECVIPRFVNFRARERLE